MIKGFHEIRFPTKIALGASGGPERHTDIVTLGSGHEERNARWADSRRRYDAGTGMKTMDDLHAVIVFFEERRGRLYGFRWYDCVDHRSCPPSLEPTAFDEEIGIGDGTTKQFQLIKTYGCDYAPWRRVIEKPIAGTLKLALDDKEKEEGADFTLDTTSGLVTFTDNAIPSKGVRISAGFYFDVPVRFDIDNLTLNISAFQAGDIPSIPLIEIK